MQQNTPGSFSRRRVLRDMGIALTATTVGHAQFDDENQADLAAMTPQQALEHLYAGNARFVKGKSQAPRRDLPRLKDVAPKQTPYAAFLGCGDSRVPIEIIFDQGFGDLFVTRIAGNVVTPECIGSLEFATHILGAKVLYILGHTSCGAVEAAALRKEVPGQISTLFQHIRPAIKAASGNVAKAIDENVRIQANLLAESSPVIAKLIDKKKLLIAGGVYQLDTGKVLPIAL